LESITEKPFDAFAPWCLIWRLTHNDHGDLRWPGRFGHLTAVEQARFHNHR
jgi:hypothetical protein